MTDLEQTAIERLKAASDMSLRLFEKPLLITYSGGKDSDVLLHLAEAADRIEAQAKEIEKLRGQNKQLREAAALVAKESAELLERRWIPVEERLPEEQVLVNVVWVNRVPEPYYKKIKGVPFSDTACFYRGRWYWDSPVVIDLLAEYGKDEFDLVDDAVEITHWMPLPQPPEVENAEAK